MVGDSIRRANIHIEQVFREVNIGHVGREYLSSVVAKEFLGILMLLARSRMEMKKSRMLAI